MMKVSKPGQLCTINRVVYRAKSRTYKCYGCALNNLIDCPNIVDFRNGHVQIACAENDIILVRVK